MGKDEADMMFKYATSCSGVTQGARQRFIIRRGARGMVGKFFVVIWTVLNTLIPVMMFLGLGGNNLSTIVILLVWLNCNITLAIVIHYTSGPSIIEELPDANETRGRVVDSEIKKPLASPMQYAA